MTNYEWFGFGDWDWTPSAYGPEHPAGDWTPIPFGPEKPPIHYGPDTGGFKGWDE